MPWGRSEYILERKEQSTEPWGHRHLLRGELVVVMSVAVHCSRMMSLFFRKMEYTSKRLYDKNIYDGHILLAAIEKKEIRV